MRTDDYQTSTSVKGSENCSTCNRHMGSKINLEGNSNRPAELRLHRRPDSSNHPLQHRAKLGTLVSEAAVLIHAVRDHGKRVMGGLGAHQDGS